MNMINKDSNLVNINIENKVNVIVGKRDNGKTCLVSKFLNAHDLIPDVIVTRCENEQTFYANMYEDVNIISDIDDLDLEMKNCVIIFDTLGLASKKYKHKLETLKAAGANNTILITLQHMIQFRPITKYTDNLFINDTGYEYAVHSRNIITDEINDD